MSKQQLPTQKGTELWPQVTRVPAVFRYHGIDLMTPEGRALHARYKSVADQFYLACAQNYALSVNQQMYAQQSIDAVLITYKNEFGRELVDIWFPEEAPQSAASERKPDTPSPPVATLAIDILFTPEAMLVGDISTWESSGGGDPADWWDQDDWDLQFSSGMGDAFFDLYGSHGPPGWYWYFGPPLPASGSGMAAHQVSGPIDLDDHDQPQLSTWIIRAALQGATYIFESGYIVPGGPPDPDKDYTREEYYYFDTNVVVAIRCEDPDRTDHAWSDKSEQSGMLSAMRGGDQISREINIEDTPADSGMVGAGFVARLSDEDRAEQEEWTFGVYLATNNIYVTNEFPDGEGSAFGVDDPTMTYAAKPEVSFRIRVREFGADTSVVPREVDVESTRRRITFIPPDNASNTPATEEDTNNIETSDRTINWSFATDVEWEDQGGEPARPDVEGVGELLDSTSTTSKAVAVPDPVEREVPAEPAWGGSIDTMTRVATIVWTPPTEAESTGSATITLD